MQTEANERLRELAVSNLERCLTKLSKISAGTWAIAGVDVSWGTMDDAIRRNGSGDDPVSAVYFDIKGELSFTSLVIFEPRDIECVSKCFLGYSFSGSQSLPQSGELLFSELGNIVLNSFISAVSNALKRSFMPSAPRYVHGTRQGLVEALGTLVDAKRSFRTITISLDIKCDGSFTRSEVIGIMPEKLEMELETAFKGSK